MDTTKYYTREKTSTSNPYNVSFQYIATILI